MPLDEALAGKKVSDPRSSTEQNGRDIMQISSCDTTPRYAHEYHEYHEYDELGLFDDSGPGNGQVINEQNGGDSMQTFSSDATPTHALGIDALGLDPDSSLQETGLSVLDAPPNEEARPARSGGVSVQIQCRQIIQAVPAAEYLDPMLIDDRIMEQMSYMDPEVQKWAFHQLLRNERGPPGVAVFDRSLSYTENVKRKPSTSQDLQGTAYIVDQKPWAKKPPSPGENEPPKFNPPGKKGNMHLIGYVNGVYDERAPGDQKNGRLAYNFAGWKKNKTRKRKAHADDDANPDNIKVCGFYLVTGEPLKKIERLSQKKTKKRNQEEYCCTSEEEAKPKNRRALGKLPENDLTTSDLGAVLYIVLPSKHEPMTRRLFEEHFPRDNLSFRTQEFEEERERDGALI